MEDGFGKSEKVANSFPQKEKLRKHYMSETKDASFILKENMCPGKIFLFSFVGSLQAGMWKPMII